MSKLFTEEALSKWDEIQESRRPGLIAIRDELIAKNPRLSTDKAECEAKVEWHRRNPGNSERRLGQ